MMDRERWKQLDGLLDALFDLEPEKRSAFLDDACHGDEPLRKEIEKLLALDERARSFIELPAMHPDGDFHSENNQVSAGGEGDTHSILSILPAQPVDGAAFHERQVIGGRYEIRSRLGKGGMGEVWHAYDLKLRVDVGLKSLRIDLHNVHDPVEALRREVRSAREVISPNVCRIFDLVVEDGRELISMEYIDGMTLMAMLRHKGPLELRQAQDIAAQFLAGLEAIHQVGLVHRDLKPENIMITRAGRVVVMDFGIAKLASQVGGTVAGTPPYMSPEQLSGKKVDARSDVFSAGVVLAEMIHPEGNLTHEIRQRIYEAVRRDPMQLTDGPWKAVVARAVAMDPADRFASAGALSRALEEATLHVETAEERKPYPGLSSFTADDAQYFFGREPEVETVIRKLQQLHMMALIGASGAGKTSFLRAGLIPALPAGWRYIFCAPGDSPFLNLGQALVPELSGDTEAMQKILRFDDPGVALWLLSRWRKKHTEVVLIIDRFEELFTLNGPEVQSRFAELITAAALEPDVRVLLSMRDDFLLRCHDHESLAPIFSELTPLGALTGPALRRALVQPGLKCGYRYEDEALVDEILSDVEKERGALPLMAFAAARLWEKRDRQAGLLTREAYKSIGGVAGALAQHAESTMERIGTERQPIVREMFRNLITAENTRAARDTEELLSVFPEKAVAETVLRSLIDARLFTSFEAPAVEGARPRRRVEIIHESLLSAWPRLVRWQTQDADSAQLRDQLRQASQLWEQRSRSEDLLWTGAAFLEFQAWRQRYSGGLTTTEDAFAQAMTRRATRKRRQRSMVVGAVILLLIGVLAIVSNFWHKATVARDDAILQARRAEAGKLLNLGRANSNADPSTKLSYALAGLELADSTEGRRFALQALSEGPPARVFKMLLRSIDFSPDGKWMAASAAGGVFLFPSDGKPPIIVAKPGNPNFYIQWGTQFSPDGKLLLFSWLKDPSLLKVWSLPEKKVVRTFDMEGATICLVRGGKVYLITDSSRQGLDETVVRVWKFDSGDPEIVGRLKMKGILWRYSDIDPLGRSITYLKGKNVYIRSLDTSGIGPETLVGTHAADGAVVRFHPNGAEIASSDQSGEIRIWSLVPGMKNPVRVIAGTGEKRTRLWFDPTGAFLLAPGDRTLLRWDLTVPESEPLVFRYQEEVPNAVAFERDGRWMAVAGFSAIAFYPLTHNYPTAFRGPGFGDDIRFMSDGKSLVSMNGVQVSNIPGEKQLPPRSLWRFGDSVHSYDVDPPGKHVLIGTENNGVHLISIADGSDLPLKSSPPYDYYQGVALSPDGKLAAASRAGTTEDRGIEIWNLESGKSRILEESKGLLFYRLKFSPDGNSLYAGSFGGGNLHQWNLIDNSHKVFRIGNYWVTSIAITGTGRYVAASSSSATTYFEKALATSDLVLYDLKEGKSIPITSHGNRVWSVAFDPDGTRLITGSLDGTVRVGPITGGVPNLLLGHEGPVGDVAVDPRGRWIVSSEANRLEVRLWQMPVGLPLQSLSYDEFMARLRTLTNVRIAADTTSPDGYRIQPAPFPGWDSAPVW